MRKLFKGGNYSREETSFFLLGNKSIISVLTRPWYKKYTYDINGLFGLLFGLLIGLLFGLFIIVQKDFLVSILTKCSKNNYLGGKLFEGGNYSRAETSF